MYIITNEGLKVLEEKGLKKILDSSLGEMDDYMLSRFPYDDEIEEYAQEHKIPNLLEKVRVDGITNQIESFIMHSGIICNLLKDKLPKNMKKDLEDVISAYYIYYDRFLERIGDRGSHLWRDEKFLNVIRGDIHGDMKIEQYDIAPPKVDLFSYKPLVKKTDLNLVDGFYPEWIRTLSDFITFCCQIEKPVPFKDNWEEVFYNGKFEEIRPGEVAKEHIERLRYAKQGEEHSFVEVLPFTDNPKKHINPEKGMYHTHPLRSDSGFLSHPFIDKDTLVYLHEAKTGVEFLGHIWGSPGVRFTYEQIPQAIKGVISCIQNWGSRCHPQDPGLVFKYFPYDRFKDLKR